MWLLSRARCVSSISLGLSSISRIVLALIWSPKCEVERRAPVHLRFGPDAPAVAVNDALHGGQADAGAWKFGRPVQALKGSEQRTSVCHIEAGAVVAHIKRGLAFGLRPTDFNPRFGLFARELGGVAQQVGQGDFQQPGVATGRQPRL